jgi:hypothetical protein
MDVPVVDDTDGRRAWSAPTERGLGPGKEPRRLSVAAARTPEIEPLLSPWTIPPTIDPRRAPAAPAAAMVELEPDAVASSEPRLAPL